VVLYNRAITEFDLQVGSLDIFGLGVALYHLLTLRYPFAEACRDDPLYRLMIEDLDEFLTEETFPHLIDGGEQTVYDFMSLLVKCFAEDPYNRPTI
jgi:serine/threonine protein kinase